MAAARSKEPTASQRNPRIPLNWLSASYTRGPSCAAPRVTGEASFAEELAGVQKGDDRFFALVGCNRDLDPAFSKVEHGIRRVSLPEDVAVRIVFDKGSPAAESSEEAFPIDRLALLLFRIDRRLVFLACHSILHRLRRRARGVKSNQFSGRVCPEWSE